MTREIFQNMVGEELIEAFKAFGPEDEFDSITRAQMAQTMQQYGEKMSD